MVLAMASNATVAQMRDLEKQGYVVTQPGRWVMSAEHAQ
jgi:hypothetical protein